MLQMTSRSPFDDKLRRLMGDGFYVGNALLKPKSLREIVRRGYLNHMSLLRTLLITKEDLIDSETLHEFKDFTIYEIILGSQEDNEFQATYIEALEYFFNASYMAIDLETHTIAFEEGLFIDEIAFNEAVLILKQQNMIQDETVKQTNENPVDEKTRKILEKLNKGKKKVEEVKRKENQSSQNIDFYSIVSAVSTKSNTISKLNVWDLTLVQLYDEYERLQLIDGYDTSILAMTQGAEIKNLQHWSSVVEE
ncbi:hypothetical protein IGA_05752 [Bacillus cereus HuA3-9]|uniref:Uncharacterized protein n=2 Tax=Bacillus cereus TaxID=1396 RepID=R8CIL7_BACCE|nr:hypothetical protein IGA_05752 [Bacillus cereus HuA3-9]